ncbi:PRE1, 20S proteasome, alpha and beta subunit [Pyrenophora tritici-repentis]|nr:PRE1, 20S proteasome, alpha and beta subunit [Pyrenophora tritici-repentis]
MDEERHREFLKLRQAQSIPIGVGLVKISITYFLLRLVTRKAYRWFLEGFIFFMVFFTAACIGTLARLLIKHHRIGHETSPATIRASNQTLLRISCLLQSAVTITANFVLAVLPIPLIRQLQLNGCTNITLVCILALGLFAGVAAIIKSEQQKAILSDPDPFVLDSFTMWRLLEYNVGIIAASLPSLRSLFRKFLNTGTRGTPPTLGLRVPITSRHSTRIKPADEDEVPLEDCKRIGSTVEISTGSKTLNDAKDRDDSVYSLASQTM